jgi:hypothetical protein
MRRYSVNWSQDAELELGRIWMFADDPDEVRAAQVRIDKVLEQQPETKG